MARWTIECAEFTICYADISIVKDDVINESNGVIEETTPHHVCYKSHGIKIVRFDQPDAIFKAKPPARKGAVKYIANIRFAEKV